MTDEDLTDYDTIPSLCANLDGRYRDIGSELCEECSASGNNPNQTEPDHTLGTGTPL